jgi:hypothetical protein
MPALAVGKVFTVIVTSSDEEQPLAVTITVYVVVTVGLAAGLDTLVDPNPAEGVQL